MKHPQQKMIDQVIAIENCIAWVEVFLALFVLTVAIATAIGSIPAIACIVGLIPAVALLLVIAHLSIVLGGGREGGDLPLVVRLWRLFG